MLVDFTLLSYSKNRIRIGSEKNMPSTYTHYRFGKDVVKHMNKDLQKIISRNKNLFLTGLHGPDIFFYYGALGKNKVNSLGYGLHGKVAIDFFTMARERIEHMVDQEEGLAYILGFICHFALDSECHGYIEYVIRRKGLTHTEIETDFERAMLLQDDKNPMTYNTASHIQAKEEYAYVISSFFKGISSYQVYRSLKLMKRYNQLLLPTNPIKEQMMKGVLYLTNNYQNMHGLIMQPKANEECILSTCEIERRYKGAIPIANRLINDFYQKLYTKEKLAQRFNRTFGADLIQEEEYNQEAYNV